MFTRVKNIFKKSQEPSQQLLEVDKKIDEKILEKKLSQAVVFITDDEQVQEEIASLVAQGVNINAKGDNGETVLHEVVFQDRLKLVEFVIQQGGDVNIRNRYGKTPLYLVGSNAVMEKLLEKGAKLDVQDNDKYSPLEGVLKRQDWIMGNPYVTGGNTFKPLCEVNEALAKIYLRENTNLKRPNCSEKLISTDVWEAWREEILEEQSKSKVARQLEDVVSARKTAIISDLQQCQMPSKEAIEILKADTGAPVQCQPAEDIMTKNSPLSLLFKPCNTEEKGIGLESVESETSKFSIK